MVHFYIHIFHGRLQAFRELPAPQLHTVQALPVLLRHTHPKEAKLRYGKMVCTACEQKGRAGPQHKNAKAGMNRSFV